MSVLEGQERLVEVPVARRVRLSGCSGGEDKTFRRYDPEQVWLMAPVLSEWVPEGDLAHFVSDLVEPGCWACRRSTRRTRTSGAFRPTTPG